MFVKNGTGELKKVLVSRPEYLKPAPINEIAKKWKDTTMDVETMLKEHEEFVKSYEDAGVEVPTNWDEMVKIAEKLGEKFPFVRVDLYNINGKIYFSEMTFTPAKGTLILDDDKCDFEMGEWLKIN